MMSELKPKTVLVTGASQGIGQSIALRLCKEGYQVAFGYKKNKAMAESAVATLMKEKLNVFAVEIQVESRESVRAAMAEVKKYFGKGVDILVNNAAISDEKPFLDISDRDWDKVMQINLRGAFICAQEVLPHMINQGWGRIINISSIGGQWGGVNQIHYAVSKAGLIGLTRSLAKTFSKDGVTTNAIAPGLVATAMTKNELASATGKEKVRNIPVARLGEADEVASIVYYLAGEESGYITGQTINVNGGMYFG